MGGMRSNDEVAIIAATALVESVIVFISSKELHKRKIIKDKKILEQKKKELAEELLKTERDKILEAIKE